MYFFSSISCLYISLSDCLNTSSIKITFLITRAICIHFFAIIRSIVPSLEAHCFRCCLRSYTTSFLLSEQSLSVGYCINVGM